MEDVLNYLSKYNWEGIVIAVSAAVSAIMAIAVFRGLKKVNKTTAQYSKIAEVQNKLTEEIVKQQNETAKFIAEQENIYKQRAFDIYIHENRVKIFLIVQSFESWLSIIVLNMYQSQILKSGKPDEVIETEEFDRYNMPQEIYEKINKTANSAFGVNHYLKFVRENQLLGNIVNLEQADNEKALRQITMEMAKAELFFEREIMKSINVWYSDLSNWLSANGNSVFDSQKLQKALKESYNLIKEKVKLV